MYRTLDSELAALQQHLVTMMDLVDEQLAATTHALLNDDTTLAARVVEQDDPIDALQMDIDRHCERILALHQPVASDLRLLIAAIKMNTDLERMGDHCKNLAKIIPFLEGAPAPFVQTTLRDMADAARTMLRQAGEALQQRDRLLARKVLVHDRQVNRLYREHVDALIAYGRTAPPARADILAHLITAGRSLERIADHAKNIARDVVFLIEGTDIRHRRLSSAGR